MTSLKNQAIQTALLGDYDTAISINSEILKANPNDIETLNRLAFAQTAAGKIKDAKITYQKVLDIDSQNPIAQRNLKKLKSDLASHFSSPNGTYKNNSHFTNIFLEETGKTKVIELINVAEPKTIGHLRSGEQVMLSIKRLKIFVTDSQKKYIGMLPDNIGNRLIKLLLGGNQYDAYIKSVNKNFVSVFIRETKRAAKFKTQPSFLLINDKPGLTFEKSKKQKSDAKEKEIDDEKSYDSDNEDDSL